MPKPEEVRDALIELNRLASHYHQFVEDPSAFLNYIASRDEEELRSYLDWAEPLATKVLDGVEQISPVTFLRRVVTQRALEGKPVTLDDVHEIQQKIDARDVDYFKDFPTFLDAISAQKERARSAFSNWNDFTVLFYIDYHRRSARVQDLLKTIAVYVRDQLGLEDCDYHLAGFNYNQNYGTDRCWIALFPERLQDHKDAYQIFVGAYPNGFEYGTTTGSRLPEDHRKVNIQTEDLDVEEMLATLREHVPSFYERNREVGATGDEADHNRGPRTKPRRLNVILYGPPGTGKTYALQRRAVEMVDGTLPEGDEVTQRFRALVRERRVEFVTFHPSYSYEEFVEGFRYDADEKIPVLQDGVFKELVSRAVNPHQRAEVREGAQIWKVSLGRSTEEDVYERCIQNDEIAIGFFDDTDMTGLTEDEIRSVFAEEGRQDEQNNIRSVNYVVNEMRDGDYIAVLKDQKTIRAIGTVDGEYRYKANYDKYRHTRPVRWRDKREHDIYEMNGGRYIGMPTVYRLNRIPLQDFVELLPDRRDDRPYVLIIDEINRGNLSRIFGELITLLEADKRQGAANELTIRLPYSKQPFTVPSNLHVLGTMNTADRSIALLDVALRRRFAFEEMMPNVEVVRKILSAALDAGDEDFELTADQIELICHVFVTLNRRITVLLDRDHQLGHSYFLEVRTMADLHRVLYQNVFPLVQEYFYNNREILTQLLGRHQPSATTGFVRSMEREYSDAFEAGEVGADELPWEIHRYRVGDLEEALTNTFGGA